MSILIIDSGTYSVKFIEGKYLKKNFKIDSVDEVLLSDIRNPNDEQSNHIELQQKIIKEYLSQINYNGKIIYQIPNEFLTTRYLDLPVTNRKKAEQMIPFQLDEELPFPSIDTHYVNSFYKNSDGKFSSIVQITEKESFNLLYSSMKENHTLPTILLSELGVIQSFIEDRKFGGHICIIDIGHSTTKAYFAYNDQILSNHIASTAGSTIDEVITNSYDINPEEARLYKHDNAFFLTEGQLDQVAPEQREFAIIMKQAFAPLTTQMQRWLLGYRIKTGFSVEKVFITGGSANIKNIDTFLTEKLEVPVEILRLNSLDAQVSPIESVSLSIPYLIGQSQKFKSTPANFLIKSYASGLINGIKLEETFFSLYRFAAVMLVFCLGLSIENFYFLNSERMQVNNDVRKLLKDQDLQIPANIQNTYVKNPTSILKYLQTKEKVVMADLNVLNEFTPATAVPMLAKLSKGIRKNEKVSLVKFTSKADLNTATFRGESNRDIDQVKELIKNLNFDSLNISESTDPLDLEISFNSEK